MSAPEIPLFDAAKRLCTARRIDPLDLLEELQRNLDSIIPPGCKVAQCGNCGRKSVVPQGSELEKIRNTLGLSLRDMASLSGYSRQYIHRVEKDKDPPPARLIEAYERAAQDAGVGAE